MTVALTLDQVNAMDLPSFTAALGWIYEHSPWVAERAWPRRPFATLPALHAALAEAVAAAPGDEQLALIRNHPDLGARARLSTASTGEQAGAGLDRLPPAGYAHLQQLNGAYREKFAFPFIYAVKGSTAGDILRALEQRLANDPATERATALAQIHRIAQFRLEEAFDASLR